MIQGYRFPSASRRFSVRNCLRQGLVSYSLAKLAVCESPAEEQGLLPHPFVTRPSTAPVLTTVAGRLSAALLVALCILPTTAPFRTLVLTDSATGRHADTVIGTMTTIHTSVTDPDDDDALVLERSQVLRESRLCALMAVASGDAAVVIGLFRPALAAARFILSFSPLKTVLRV
jgi:hypothetical protein